MRAATSTHRAPVRHHSQHAFFQTVEETPAMRTLRAAPPAPRLCPVNSVNPASPARPAPLALAIALALAASAAAPHAWAQGQPAETAAAIHLPAQPLGQALNELARQAGLQLLVRPELVAGKTAPAVSGRLTARQALQRLLAGSGLAADVRGAEVTVRPLPAAPARPAAPATPAAAPGEAQALPAVTVTAAPDLSGTTEGTRSFTTRAMSSATGLALSPRETPQSVSVITRERIEAQGLGTLSDAVAATPGMHTMPNDTRGDRMSARGFEINNYQIDGVSLNWPRQWDAGETRNNLAMYDRVEVVRGATGLLTGAGEPSASINMVRKRAESDVFTGQVQGELGSWQHRSGMADVSAPLNASRSVRARVVAQATSRDTFIDREHIDSQLFYGTVEADLSDATRLTLGGDWQNFKPRGAPWSGLLLWDSEGRRITDWPRGYSLAANWGGWASTQKTLFAKLEHRFNDDWTLKLDAQHADNNADLKLSWPEGAPDRHSGGGVEFYNSYQQSERNQKDLGLRLNGAFNAWGRRHELMTGLIWARQRWWAEKTHEGEYALPNVWAFDGTVPEPPRLAEPELMGDVRSTQRAAYVAARLHVAEPLKLIVGTRVTDLKRTGGAGAIWHYAFQTHDKHVFTPYIGAVYDLGGSYSAYASATRIFKPQEDRDRHGQPLPSLQGRNLEAGLKAEWLDGQLTGSLAVFQTTQDKLAVPDGNLIVPGTVDEQAYRAANNVKTRGYELELTGRLAPGWDVSLGWTQLSTKEADGARVRPQHPSRMLKLYTQYRLPGAWNKLTLGGGLNWQGRTYTNTENPVTGAPEQLRQNAYALLNLSARYQFTPQLGARLAVNNVLDKRYLSNVSAFDRLQYGAPRSVMLTVDYRF
ncbi:TonB-dependent siderophore receptor [Comamonadaceae bacterium OH2545_COT-014]|nr:TonB-dependent siderophore receptor [Comamonadaceae bacterium OH2545_COT-014]